jgi:hypothetical protein
MHFNKTHQWLSDFQASSALYATFAGYSGTLVVCRRAQFFKTCMSNVGDSQASGLLRGSVIAMFVPHMRIYTSVATGHG